MDKTQVLKEIAIIDGKISSIINELEPQELPPGFKQPLVKKVPAVGEMKIKLEQELAEAVKRLTELKLLTARGDYGYGKN